MAYRMLTRYLILLILLLTINAVATGQAINVNREAKEPVRSELSSLNRSQAMALVRSFAERAIQFDDTATKVVTLCNLSALLWKDDSSYATKLITASFEAVEKCPAEQCPQRQKSYLRNVVISRAAKLDAALIQQLMNSITDNRNSANSSDKATNLVFAAIALLDNSAPSAISLAEQSLRLGVVKELRSFLFRLRIKDPRAADELFSKALAAMVSQPVLDANLLMHLGAYLYKGSTISETESAVEMIVIGDQLVVDLAIERTHISQAVARLYLNNAVDVLSRPVTDPEQLKLSHAAATQLFPKVQKVLPDRVAQLRAVLNSGAPKMEESSLDRRSPPEKEVATGTDSTLLEKLSASLDVDDFERASESANKITDPQAKKQSLNLIKFYEALKSIESDLETAQHSILKLDSSKEKAVAYLTLANKHLERREKPAAHQAFAEALNEVRALPANEQGVFLLAAAHAMLALDISSAKDVYAESLKKFPNNDLEILMLISWTRTIIVDKISHRFPLTVTRIEHKPANLMRPFLSTDREWAIGAILQLRNEKVLGPLLVSVAHEVLQEDTKEGIR